MWWTHCWRLPQATRSVEIYNVGSGNPVSVNELVRLLGSPPTVHIPKRPGEPDCTWADITKIRHELGWQPKVSFADGVRVMLQNIDYWRDAPVWTASRIAEATSRLVSVSWRCDNKQPEGAERGIQRHEAEPSSRSLPAKSPRDKVRTLDEVAEVAGQTAQTAR